MAWHNAEMNPLTRKPRRPSRKKQTRRKTVLAFYALLALFVIAGAALAIRMFGYGAARDEYAAYQAADIHVDVPFETTVPEPTMLPEAVAAFVPPSPAPSAPMTATPFYSEKVASLHKVNRDAVGWLDIVNTEMQYPVVQGKDNAYYILR